MTSSPSEEVIERGNAFVRIICKGSSPFTFTFLATLEYIYTLLETEFAVGHSSTLKQEVEDKKNKEMIVLEEKFTVYRRQWLHDELRVYVKN